MNYIKNNKNIECPKNFHNLKQYKLILFILKIKDNREMVRSYILGFVYKLLK